MTCQSMIITTCKWRGDDDYMVIEDPDDPAWNVGFEHRTMQRLYNILKTDHYIGARTKYRSGPTVSFDQDASNRGLVEHHTPDFEEWYKPSVTPEMMETDPSDKKLLYIQRIDKKDGTVEFKKTKKPTTKNNKAGVMGINQKGEVMWRWNHQTEYLDPSDDDRDLEIPEPEQPGTRNNPIVIEEEEEDGREEEQEAELEGFNEAPHRPVLEDLIPDGEADAPKPHKVPLPDDSDSFDDWDGE